MKRFTLTIEWGSDDPPERESATDAMVERAELDGRRPVGFGTWEDRT